MVNGHTTLYGVNGEIAQTNVMEDWNIEPDQDPVQIHSQSLVVWNVLEIRRIKKEESVIFIIVHVSIKNYKW